MPESKRSYDVIGSISGVIQTFATGLDIDAAQALKTQLETDGIGGPRTSDTGERDAPQNTLTVDNVTVVRSAQRGEASVSEFTEVLTVTPLITSSSGTYFTPSVTPQELVSLTVNSSGAPDVTAELLQNGKIYVNRPKTLTDTDEVSATYKYETTPDIQGTTDTLTPDGSARIFTLSKNYIQGSVQASSLPDVSNVYIREGGGNLVEAGYIQEDGTSAALPAGSGDVELVYQYSSGEQAVVPSEKATREFDRKEVTPGIPQVPPIE